VLERLVNAHSLLRVDLHARVASAHTSASAAAPATV
jgi:hypothetical protein